MFHKTLMVGSLAAALAFALTPAMAENGKKDSHSDTHTTTTSSTPATTTTHVESPDASKTGVAHVETTPDVHTPGSSHDVCLSGTNC